MHASVHEVEAAQIIAVVTAIAIVAAWRVVLKGLLAVIFIFVIAALGFGLIMIWQITHAR